MRDSLPALEAERTQILRQIGKSAPWANYGEVRGSICAVPRRCGKPTCHRAKPKDPGRNPPTPPHLQGRWQTVARSFAAPAAFHKAQAKSHECQRAAEVVL
jgi:hypothetical protein